MTRSPWELFVDVTDLSGDGQSCEETRERSVTCYWTYFPLICMEDVANDACGGSS